MRSGAQSVACTPVAILGVAILVLQWQIRFEGSSHFDCWMEEFSARSSNIYHGHCHSNGNPLSLEVKGPLEVAPQGDFKVLAKFQRVFFWGDAEDV